MSWIRLEIISVFLFFSHSHDLFPHTLLQQLQRVSWLPPVRVKAEMLQKGCGWIDSRYCVLRGLPHPYWSMHSAHFNWQSWWSVVQKLHLSNAFVYMYMRSTRVPSTIITFSWIRLHICFLIAVDFEDIAYSLPARVISNRTCSVCVLHKYQKQCLHTWVRLLTVSILPFQFLYVFLSAMCNSVSFWKYLFTYNRKVTGIYIKRKLSNDLVSVLISYQCLFFSYAYFQLL